MGKKTNQHRRVPMLPGTPQTESNDEPMLGFAGLVASGMTPDQAFDQIASATHTNPEVQAIVEQMQRTPEGRAALEEFRQGWADENLPAPWENRLELDERSV